MPRKSLAGSSAQLLPAPPPGKGASRARASLRLPGHCSSEIFLSLSPRGGPLSASASASSRSLLTLSSPALPPNCTQLLPSHSPNTSSTSCPGCSLACANSLPLAEPAPRRPAGSAPKTCWRQASLLQHLGTWASVQAHFIIQDMRTQQSLGHRPLRPLVVVAVPLPAPF